MCRICFSTFSFISNINSSVYINTNIPATFAYNMSWTYLSLGHPCFFIYLNIKCNNATFIKILWKANHYTIHNVFESGQ